MTKVEILGANRFETYTKTRGASRAVIVRDGMILLVHEASSDLWMIPGGGIEEGETPEKCCVREAEEETGNLVLPLQEFTTLFEYYEEYCYITHYFICEVTGSGRMQLTEAEVRRGAEPRWIPLSEAMEIFSRHQSYADVSEEKRGICLREYTALQEYLKIQPQRKMKRESDTNDYIIRLETERLVLRPWEESDAEECYKFAKDPRVGPAAGWPAHSSVENSRQVIRDVLMVPETYAIVLKETGLPVGSIGLHHNDLAEKEDEAELGYWIGVPYWGRGLVPEAARELLRHAFEDLKLNRVWCGYYDGNEKSKRVQEKLGFVHQWTNEAVPVPQMGETRIGHVNLLTKEQWEQLNRGDQWKD